MNIGMKNKSNLDRRNFLKKAGLTGALSLYAGIPGWAYANVKSNVLSVGSDSDIRFFKNPDCRDYS